MVTVTEFGDPALRSAGRLVPRATVSVSSSASASWSARSVAVPDVAPALIGTELGAL